MTDKDVRDSREFWNNIADDWRIQVGDDGDVNRRLNSDPILWKFAGSVSGRTVLDAGCGTGYLSKKLHDAGASVIGVDFSPRMIEIARAHNPDLEFRVDSCAELTSINDEQFDIVIANYVLMDCPDLNGAVCSFHRVLKPAGHAVLVFSHPCFIPGRAESLGPNGELAYIWRFPYFEQRRVLDPPWAHFKMDFIWFHRPLSDYWKAFTAAGFSVLDFDEPRIPEDRYHLAANPHQLDKLKHRPYSVVFKLQKNPRATH